MLAGNLFTRDYLLEAIARTEPWKSLTDKDFLALKQRLSTLAQSFAKHAKPNEAVTEKDFIYPVMEVLGWSDILVQPNMSTKGRKQVPDALLLADAEAKSKAVSEGKDWKGFKHGLAILEAKRWERSLDTGTRGEEGAPDAQMLQYLSRVDIQTDGKVRLGILTNGVKWRLYFQGALSVAEDFFEIDLAKALDLPGHDLDIFDTADKRMTRDHCLRLFILMFSRAAFLPSEGHLTFHEQSRETGKVWEEQVTKDLSHLVFDELFPRLVTAIAANDKKQPANIGKDYLDQVRQSALVLLYRLLFVVYAEDRDLLPDNRQPYKDFSLTTMRLEIAKRKADGKAESSTHASFWPRLTAIFKAISEGDNDFGIPPYNGGLFAKETAPLLAEIQLPDAIVTDLVYGLSHRIEDGEPRYINYRDLSVQQLGSVYERTLEYGLRLIDGKVVIDPDDAARHESGSYYTPDSLVMLIIEKAVGPFVAAALDTFHKQAALLSKDKRVVNLRLGELRRIDPARTILSLKICDPAMGSGHFLVSLVDWLADKVLSAMSEAQNAVEWGDYESPLAHEITKIRDDIIDHAHKNNWPYVAEHLQDRHIVRRMVLKRCVYGVDKNPLAVELAKVALWLHTFTVGAPLSFLDHHLRCGDSLFGAWVRPAMDRLVEWGSPLLMNAPLQRAFGAAAGMQTIEKLTDADIAEVYQSKNLFDGIESMTSELTGLLTLVHATEWQEPKSKLDIATVQAWTKGAFGDPVKLAAGALKVTIPPAPIETEMERKKRELSPKKKVLFNEHETATTLSKWLPDTKSRIESERFLHWQVAFPGIWHTWESAELHGGFDAVIGNPPYVRHELIKPIKPGLKRAYPDTYDGSADLYVYFYDQGLKLLKPGGRLSYVVTNKWMRAGYAEGLRDLFASKAWIEFVADFGHAKKFFPDADVFPSVLVVRKPDGGTQPANTSVCVIPRDDVPEKALDEAVAKATYPLPLAHFTKESWTLEPPDVVALLEKIRRAGVPLTEAAGVKPYRGVLTGFNEAFLVDTPTKDALIREHSRAATIIKPFVRGQDVSRWRPNWQGLWMIFTRRGIDIDAYPSVKRHLSRFREQLEPKPTDWQPATAGGKWSGRKEGTYAWYEIQDAIDYWQEFSKPKIIYQEIQFHPAYAYDEKGLFSNNKTFILTTDEPSLLTILNSPLMWWFNWRFLPHMKDEALSPMGFKMEHLPIATFSIKSKNEAARLAKTLIEHTNEQQAAAVQVLDWLHHSFGIEIPKSRISTITALDADGLIDVVIGSVPKKRKLTAAEIAELKREHAATIEPARQARAEIFALERKLSDLVNEAYGLTPEEVQLMWRTAPPRMPFTPAGLVADAAPDSDDNGSDEDADA
ncbi:MAG: Eco57I restriction-modification methylase domain-containing protein [Hyphomicrobiaceae bacterium]|nr:Eco57I restriction-modification methylase domain-containing protein [Hyphomicrobiaceae bacterium]